MHSDSRPRLSSRAEARCNLDIEMALRAHEDDIPNPQRRELKFRRLEGMFAVVRLPADAPVPDWAETGPFISITRNADELSIVCRQENVPLDVRGDHCCVCLKLEGPFAFSEVGVLVSFIGPLATGGVPVFAISTYDTDYVLISKEFAETAQAALSKAGHQLISDDESCRKPIE